MPKYIRDGRAPIPKREMTSRVMSANRGVDTSPELLLRRALSQRGVRGYRLHPKKVPGRPDIAFPRKRITILVNGCFWHRCARCAYPLPKSNRAFWVAKFKRNQRRDERKTIELKVLGWKVLTIWEHEIKRDAAKAALRVSAALHDVRSKAHGRVV